VFVGQGSAAGVAATACPSVDTLGFLDAAVPSGLPPADLVDAVIACERLVAHVHGVQTRLLAELGRRGTLCGWARRKETAWQKFDPDAA